MDPSDARCHFDYEDAINPLFLIVVPGSTVVCSIIGALLIVAFSINFYKNNAFHVNAKILFFAQLGLYFGLCIEFIVAYGEHLFRALFQREQPCSFFKLASDCSIHFYVYTTMVSASAIIQVSIGIERVVATVCVKNYAKAKGIFGSVLVLATFILAILFAIFVLFDYDPFEFRMGCYGIPMTTGTRSLILYVGVVVCDVTSIASFAIAFVISYKREKNTVFSSYQLEKDYHRIENGRLMVMLIPNVAFQSLSYILYSTATIWSRSLLTTESNGLIRNMFIRHNSLPIFIVGEIGFILLFMKRVKANKKKFAEKLSAQDLMTQAYFANLAKQWN